MSAPPGFEIDRMRRLILIGIVIHDWFSLVLFLEVCQRLLRITSAVVDFDLALLLQPVPNLGKIEKKWDILTKSYEVRCSSIRIFGERIDYLRLVEITDLGTLDTVFLGLETKRQSKHLYATVNFFGEVGS